MVGLIKIFNQYNVIFSVNIINISNLLREKNNISIRSYHLLIICSINYILTLNSLQFYFTFLFYQIHY